MSLTKMQEMNASGTVSTDNMSNLISEQNEDMMADSFGGQVEDVSMNFGGNQDDYLNFSFKKAGKKFFTFLRFISHFYLTIC